MGNKTEIKYTTLKTYLIYKYLLENSDENNCISTKTLSAHIKENFGIPAESRSLYRDIDALNIMLYAIKNDLTIDEAKAETDELEDKSWRSIVYDGSKKGFYVKHRYYDLGEEYTLNDVKTIAECIYSAKFITESKAKKYVNIITKILTSESQSNEIKHDAMLLDRGKTLSSDLFDNIQKINKAMKTTSGATKHTPEKISFKYISSTIKGTTERRHGERYIISPYKIIINDGNYYLLGYDDKQAKTMTYRIDRMKDIRLLGLPRDGSELFKADDDKTLAMRTFGMYDGKNEYVTLRFINPMLDTVKDKFGNKLYFNQVDEKHFTVQVQAPITDQFFGWLCGLGRRVKIIAPLRIQEQFKEYLEKILTKYE